MYVGKCAYCGMEIVSQYKSKARNFCSKACLKNFKNSGMIVFGENNLQIAANKRYICKYNCEITCKDRKCAKCGWNPTVARRRLNRFVFEMVEGCVNV